jgi:hypothetical protein
MLVVVAAVLLNRVLVECLHLQQQVAAAQEMVLLVSKQLQEFVETVLMRLPTLAVVAVDQLQVQL